MMPHQIKLGKNTRMSYSKINEASEMPNLIAVQKDSYKWFLQEGLKEVLEDREMSQQELALRTGVTPKHISTVLSGEKNISVSFAKKLEYALDIDAEFWMNLQNLYDKELFEFDELHSISKEEIDIFKGMKDVFDFIVNKNFIPKIR